jgi:hypothetical protein
MGTNFTTTTEEGMFMKTQNIGRLEIKQFLLLAAARAILLILKIAGKTIMPM